MNRFPSLGFGARLELRDASSEALHLSLKEVALGLEALAPFTAPQLVLRGPISRLGERQIRQFDEGSGSGSYPGPSDGAIGDAKGLRMAGDRMA